MQLLDFTNCAYAPYYLQVAVAAPFHRLLLSLRVALRYLLFSFFFPSSQFSQIAP